MCNVLRKWKRIQLRVKISCFIFSWWILMLIRIVSAKENSRIHLMKLPKISLLGHPLNIHITRFLSKTYYKQQRRVSKRYSGLDLIRYGGEPPGSQISPSVASNSCLIFDLWHEIWATDEVIFRRQYH